MLGKIGVMDQNTKLKVVIGLGKTGISCINYLISRGANIAIIDSRDNPPGINEIQKKYPQIPLHLGNFNAAFLSQASEIIVSPGVALKEPVIANAIKQGIPVIGDIELFAREAKAPIVAITGSNGKSTVTSLVCEMAKAAGINVKVGANLGEPALDLLDAKAELYVLELSSFQLETTYSLKAQAAVVLNISEDHMDRYENLEEYTLAKKRIYHNCKVAVINRDDPASFSGVKLPEKIFSFGLNAKDVDFGVNSDFSEFICEGKIAFPTNKLKIKGLHQIANALAALALGRAVYLPYPAMFKALEEFPGLEHRCQWVREINGINWYNDSKGTNVGATLAAIIGIGKSIKGKVVLIAGGLGKDADFSPLQNAVTAYVRTVILIGKDAKLIASALPNNTEIIFADSMHQAVALAAEHAKINDAVLLSPACASFDMFDNFEHRGKVFMEEVKLIKN